MISVLLTIVKIIGIVLLCILGLLLLVLLSVLLVPLRYQAEGSCREEKWNAAARVTWLCHLLCVQAGYQADAGPFWRVRILGFPLIDSRRTKTGQSQKTSSQKAAESEEKDKTEPIPDISPEVLDSLPGESPPPEQTEKKSGAKPETEKSTSRNAVRETEEPEQKQARGDAKKEQKAEEKNQKKEKRKQEQAKKSVQKEEKQKERAARREKAEDLLDLLQNKENQCSLRMVKSQAGKLLHHILPQKIRLVGRIGLSDPAATGQLMGLVYAFYPLYGDSIRLTGDFEEKVMEGELFLKGRIRIGSLIIIAARVVLDKNIRRMIKTVGGKSHVGE